MESQSDLLSATVHPAVVNELQRSRPWITTVVVTLYSIAGLSILVVPFRAFQLEDLSWFTFVLMICLVALVYGFPALLLHRTLRAITLLRLNPNSHYLLNALRCHTTFWILCGCAAGFLLIVWLIAAVFVLVQ